MKILPAGQYAKFTLNPSESCWDQIFGEWLPASSYQGRGSVLERYPVDRCIDDDLEGSQVDVFVPIGFQ